MRGNNHGANSAVIAAAPASAAAEGRAPPIQASHHSKAASAARAAGRKAAHSPHRPAASGASYEQGKVASFSNRLDGGEGKGEWEAAVVQDHGVWFGTLATRTAAAP